MTNKLITNNNLVVAKGKKIIKTDENYELIIQRKQELEAKINELNADLDGKENMQVALKINNFELEKSKISKEIEVLNENLVNLKGKLELITSNISKFSGGKKQVLLDAIKEMMKGKRFFFFKEPKEILFDCETGYLWANLDYHKGIVDENIYYTRNASLELLKKIKYANLNNWNLPQKNEAERMINDRKFPYNTNKSCHDILNRGSIYTSDTKAMWLDQDYPKPYNGDGLFLPCNSTFATKDLDPANKVFTDNEKAEKILNIFVSNNWVPKFNNEEHTALYIKLFKTRPALIEEYAVIEQKIAELEKNNTKNIKNFDLEKELQKYDLTKVNRSLLTYNDNIIYWINNLLDGIKDFKKDENNILKKAHEINQKLNNMTSENEIIKKRNEFLREKLDFDIETTEFKFIEIKKQVVGLNNKIKSTINLEELAKFEEIKYPSFVFMAEHTANILNEKLSSINWFSENLETIENLLLINEEWSDEFKQFNSMFKDEFIKKCKSEMVAEKIYKIWVENWSKERNMLEEKFLPILKAGLEKTISFELLSEIEKGFKNHRENLKKFYMNKRIDIYNKNADKDEDGLFDKIAYEKEIAQITEEFHKTIEKFIFMTDNTESKLFIAELISNWYEKRVLDAIDLAENKGISKEMTKFVLEKLRDFKKSEFNDYIKDKEAYAEHREKQYAEYQSLMRKMKVSLEE